ncbi:MAG: hypothetical protein AB8E15_02635 [Bdellovibrionales bacterium]
MNTEQIQFGKHTGIGLLFLVAILAPNHSLDTGITGEASLSSIHGAKKLEQIWKADIKKLRSKKKLPKYFYSVKEIAYSPMTEKAAKMLSRARIPIPLNYKGKFKLNVAVDDWKQKRESGAVVHYQFVDIKSGNTQFELSRTYRLK